MDIDLVKIKVLSNNDIVYEKGYNDLIKLRFKLEGMFSPFGVEKYYSKFIVNLNFKNKDKNNKMYNYHAILKSIDNHLSKMEFEGKTYSSFIKDNGKFDPSIRCHLRSKKENILTKIYDDGKFIESDKIKSRYMNAVISLGPLWVKNNSYGAIIYIDKIELTN